MKTERDNMIINIIITEIICAVLVLCSVLLFKYCFRSEYKSLKNWYIKEICANTSVSEVLK